MTTRLLVALALLVATARGAASQGIVGGRVLEATTQRPVGCLSVALLDADARPVGRTQTREDGTFDLPAPPRGRYRLEFSAFGLRPAATEPTDLDETSEVERDYRIELVPHDALGELWRGVQGDAVPRHDPRRRPVVPRFPQALLDRGVTRADAILGYVVDARGRADSATAFRLFSSAPEFYDNALTMIHTQRYLPAKENGVAVCRFVVEPIGVERQSMNVIGPP